MYERTDKRRLYWLINRYLIGKFKAETFCDEYYYCYGLEVDSDTFTILEDKAFSELMIIAGRFSPFEEDDKPSRGGFYTEKELKPKVISTQEKLKAEQIELIKTFGHSDKRKLYWLIDQYLLNNINILFFCNEFVEYYNALDIDLLTELEYKAFAMLNPIAGSFSKFKDDFTYPPGTSYTVDDLKKKVIETKELLSKEELTIL